jgi:Integrase core domain
LTPRWCAPPWSPWWLRKPAKGLLVHTDRGSQYAGGRYGALAAELGITMSMSRRANAWDNAPIESFFKTLKVERIYQVRDDTRAQARLDIVDWIEGWYNRQRLHSANGFLAPVTWENAQLAAWLDVRGNEAGSNGFLPPVIWESARLAAWLDVRGNEAGSDHCRAHGLEQARSRAYRKNDQAWVEQKNGSIVRRLVGYGRLSGLPATRALAQLYSASRL